MLVNIASNDKEATIYRSMAWCQRKECTVWRTSDRDLPGWKWFISVRRSECTVIFLEKVNQWIIFTGWLMTFWNENRIPLRKIFTSRDPKLTIGYRYIGRILEQRWRPLDWGAATDPSFLNVSRTRTNGEGAAAKRILWLFFSYSLRESWIDFVAPYFTGRTTNVSNVDWT